MSRMKSYKICKPSLLMLPVVLLLLFFMPNPLPAQETSPGVSITEESQPEEDKSLNLKEEEAGVDSSDDLDGQKNWYGKFSDRFLMIADFNGFFTRSDMNGAESLPGGSVSGNISPTYRFNDETFFVLMYNGNYNKRREFYSDDIGPRERSEYQGHTITPMLRMDFGERSRYTITPSFFYTRTYNKDTTESGWSEGLYNYRDTGEGLDFKMKGMGFGGADGALELGAQYYKRRYPNYESLLDLATGLGTEKDEKDYHGVIVKAGYDWITDFGFSWSANYSLLYKMLDDKKVVDEDGVLTDDEQHDYLHTLDADLRYFFFWGLRVGLGLRGGLNTSSQNYYDGMDTLTLADDVFLPEFYDYYLYRLEPKIFYTFTLFPLTPSLSYAYQRMDYSDRKAKFRDGIYKDEDQWETQKEINFRLRYDITRSWSLLAWWQHIAARSNNDDDRVYRYDYTINNYSIGVSFRY
ncbi:MAG: hypothetical protein JRJ02_07905 [Deltaproteobacteria bacterium]|nr:hypothetical protein [Deltaproteobacteria bacterium]